MFGILLKKQLFELCRGLFYNEKKGKMRSKAGIFGMAVLFIALILFSIGGCFTAFGILLSEPFYMANVGYLYFIIFGLISVVLGLIGSVFSTYSGLYLAKDNDLLFSMPIPAGAIVASRLASTYLIGLSFSSLVFIPVSVVWLVKTGFTIQLFLGNIAALFEITLIVWVLSCLLGFAIAKISLKFRGKSFVTVIAGLAFIGLYYYVYFKANDLLEDILENAAVYGEKIKGSAYILYAWGMNALGGVKETVVFLLICLALTAITYLLLCRTFFGIATVVLSEKKKAVHNTAVKENTISSALLKKEFSRFTSSANYMLNCGLGIIFTPVIGFALLFKGNELIEELTGIDSSFSAVITIILTATSGFVGALNDSAVPSVSLEGKSLWIVQSLPIEPWQVIKAKLKMQLLLSEIPMVIFCICIIPLSLPFYDKIVCIVCSLLITLMFSLFCMFIGLKMPIMNWTNEIIPIKQSGGVAVALFSSWGYVGLLVGGYFLLNHFFDNVNEVLYITAFSVLSAVLSLLLYRWLKTKGCEVLKEL